MYDKKELEVKYNFQCWNTVEKYEPHRDLQDPARFYYHPALHGNNLHKLIT